MPVARDARGAEEILAAEATAPLDDLVVSLLDEVHHAFGNALSSFGRDLFLIDGDALLGYLLAEEPAVAAAAQASKERHAREDAALGGAAGSSDADDFVPAAGHPVFDFQTLPVVFRAEQFLTHLFELGAEFRVFFLQVHGTGWSPQHALLRQALVWHLDTCTSFTVDSDVVHPWHPSWADYLSLHLPSYILSFVDWEWPESGLVVKPRTAVITRAAVLSMLAEGRSVVVLRGVAEGERVDVSSARLDAFALSRISDPLLMRRTNQGSTMVRRVREEVVAPAEATIASCAGVGAEEASAPAWPHAALGGADVAALVPGGWRLAVTVTALAAYLRLNVSGGNNSDGVPSDNVALAATFLWHTVAMQHLPVELRAIPAAGLPVGALDEEVELAGATLSGFVQELSGHLAAALAAAVAHATVDPASLPASAEAGTANVADLVDIRLLRFLHVVLPRAIASAGGQAAGVEAVAKAVLGGDDADAAATAASALAAGWKALGAIGGADVAASVTSTALLTPSPGAQAAGANKFVRKVARAAEAATPKAPRLSPMNTELARAILGDSTALSDFEDSATLRDRFPFPFGDSFCWHQGTDFGKLPDAFDKVKDQAESKAAPKLSDRELKKLQRKANAVARRSASLAGGVVERQTIIVKGIWSEADQVRQRQAEAARGGGRKGKKGKGGTKAPKGGWSTGKKGKKGKGSKVSRADQIRAENIRQALAKEVANAREQLSSLEATVTISMGRDKYEDAMGQLAHFKPPTMDSDQGVHSEEAVVVNMQYQAARLEVLLAWQQWTLRRIAMGKGDAQAGLGSWSSSPASMLYVCGGLSCVVPAFRARCPCLTSLGACDSRAQVLCGVRRHGHVHPGAPGLQAPAPHQGAGADLHGARVHQGAGPADAADAVRRGGQPAPAGVVAERALGGRVPAERGRRGDAAVGGEPRGQADAVQARCVAGAPAGHRGRP